MEKVGMMEIGEVGGSGDGGRMEEVGIEERSCCVREEIGQREGVGREKGWDERMKWDGEKK